MSNNYTYTWEITKLECKKQENGMENVVFNCFYERKGTTIKDNVIHTSKFSSNVYFRSPIPEEFIPYNTLTKEIVVSWLETHLDVADIDSKLQETIDNKINPRIITLPLPF